MLLAQVVGQVVATVKEPGLSGFKLLLCAPFEQPAGPSEQLHSQPDPADQPAGRPGPAASQPDAFVAVDLVGAGFGEVVLVAAGSAARIPAVSAGSPVDRAIVAIVDSVTDQGATTYSTS